MDQPGTSTMATPPSAGPSEYSKASGSKSPQKDKPTPPTCAICIRRCRNKCSTNSCMHQFCFKCLFEWSKVKPECPLCKQIFNTIIHTPSNLASINEEFLSLKGRPEPAKLLGMYREEIKRGETDSMSLNQQWRLHVYERKLYALPMPDKNGRLGESSAVYYRKNPQQVPRVIQFMRRDFVCLLRCSQFLVPGNDKIATLLSMWDLLSAEFTRAMQPFLGRKAMHFVHEANNFARSPCTLDEYDHAVQYLTSNPEEIFEFSDEDSSESELDEVRRSSLEAPEETVFGSGNEELEAEYILSSESEEESEGEAYEIEDMRSIYATDRESETEEEPDEPIIYIDTEIESSSESDVQSVTEPEYESEVESEESPQMVEDIVTISEHDSETEEVAYETVSDASTESEGQLGIPEAFYESDGSQYVSETEEESEAQPIYNNNNAEERSESSSTEDEEATENEALEATEPAAQSHINSDLSSTSSNECEFVAEERPAAPEFAIVSSDTDNNDTSVGQTERRTVKSSVERWSPNSKVCSYRRLGRKRDAPDSARNGSKIPRYTENGPSTSTGIRDNNPDDVINVYATDSLSGSDSDSSWSKARRVNNKQTLKRFLEERSRSNQIQPTRFDSNTAANRSHKPYDDVDDDDSD